MAENESIGGIAVDIVGDYSHLKADIDGAVQVAAAGGEKLASALNAGAAGADALSGAMASAASASASFEEQIAALVGSGSTLAEALAAVGTGAEAIGGSVEAAGSAAAQAAEQMSLFDAAIEVPYADAAGQLNMFATELEPLGPDAQQAAAGLDALGQAAQQTGGHEEELAQATTHAGEAAHEAESETAEFLKELLAFAGIGVSIEALKEFAEEALNLYAAEERAGEGIAFLRGNIQEADAVLTNLKETAQDLALPFESVVHAAQKMAFFKLTTEETQRAIEAASDASKASGQSFDSMANSINNIALAGNAMPRTLRQIGVSIEDLASVMEVSAGEVQKIFKEMGQTDRLEALIGAMDRTRGAGKAMADDLTSNVTRMKNSWEFALTEMGGAIAPLALEAIPTLVTAMKGIIDVGVTVVTVIKVLTDTIVGITTVALQAVSGLGSVWFDVMTGQFSKAKDAAVDALNNIKAAGKFTWDSIAADAQKGFEILDKLWEEQKHTAKEASDDEIASGVAAAAAAAKEAAARLAAAAELKKELKEVEAFGKSIALVLGESSRSYEDYLTSLYDGGKKASSILGTITQDIIKGEAAAESMNGAPKQAMLAFIEALKQAQGTMRGFQSEDEMTKSWEDILAKRLAYAKKIEEAAIAYDEQITADQQKAAIMSEQGELTHQVKLLDIQKAAAAAAAQVHNITVFEKLAIDESANVKEEQLARDALAAELATLDASTIAYTDYATKREAIVLKVQALQDKIDGRKQVEAITAQTEAYKALGLTSEKALSTQIKEADQALQILKDQNAALGLIYAGEEKDLALRIKKAELTGQSATAEIIALESVRLKQEALYNSTHALGDLAVGIEQDIWKGWQQVGSALVDDALEGKNFAKSMEDVGKQVVKMVMNDLVGYAFKELKTAIVGVGGAIKDVQGNWDALHKAIMDATGMTSGAKDAAGAVKGATGGAGGAISMVDAIANVGSLISNIVSNVQFAHMNDSLKVIVQHTLVAANELTNLREDAWSQFNQMYDRIGELWRDMRTGFQALADGIVTGTTQAADDATQTRNIFKDGVIDIVGAVRNTGDASKRTPPTSSGTPYNPFTGVQADIWAGLTMPSSNPPPLPTVPSSARMVTPTAATVSSSSSTSIGAVTFNVYESQNPRQTVRSISESLKILSPQFAAYST